MKGFYMLLLTMMVFVLSACDSSNQIQPIKEETLDFDLKTATQMVEKKETMIMELAKKKELSISEFREIERYFTADFGDHAKDILSMLTLQFMDEESKKYIAQDTFYPTVFHEGIHITSAVIYRSYYENDFFNQTRLTIREEYEGDDKELEDWYREYIFTLNKDTGEWELHGFSGILNYSGEEFNLNYLELKQ
ncbi:hypothetical protein [Marinicrinis lubricantis]|uniref:DUF3993 domain-containing protein n=1 Tax=Marinicrinis lubricantis TaxID=2086470 RepID=A0ABW1IN64_9BACL